MAIRKKKHKPDINEAIEIFETRFKGIYKEEGIPENIKKLFDQIAELFDTKDTKPKVDTEQ